MKESKGFKMLHKAYLSCIGKIDKKLIDFHKDILKKYLRPLGANPLGFLESYFGLRMFSSPVVKMLNLPEVEMVYLIQPVMNILSMKEGLNSEKKPSAYPSVGGQIQGALLETRRKVISGGSANFIKSFLPIYKHKYMSTFIESSFHNRLKQNSIYLDSNSESFSAVKTAKSEIFTRKEETFLDRSKFDLTTPKRLALISNIPFPALQGSKVADTFFSLFKTQSRKLTFFPDNTVSNGAKDDLDKWDSKITSHLYDQQSPSFIQRSTGIYHSPPPEARPTLHLGRSSLRIHNPIIDTQHTRIKEDALSDENAPFSLQFIFVDRHQIPSRSLKVMKVKKDTNSRGDVSSYPIGIESPSLSAPAQHSIDYEIIVDRVCDIIENRLRIETERE